MILPSIIRDFGPVLVADVFLGPPNHEVVAMSKHHTARSRMREQAVAMDVE